MDAVLRISRDAYQWLVSLPVRTCLVTAVSWYYRVGGARTVF